MNRTSPVQLEGTAWKAVTVGGLHTCAINGDSTLWCWGDNEAGQLGEGTTEPATTPTEIRGTTWKTITAGGLHTCGTQSDDTLWCWGHNSTGQVGDGTTADTPSPVQVGTATWKTVSAGPDYSCAIRTAGSLWCWGDNLSGQLGDGTTTDRQSPTQIGGLTSWASVDAGGSHALASERLRCTPTEGRDAAALVGQRRRRGRSDRRSSVSVPQLWLWGGG